MSDILGKNASAVTLQNANGSSLTNLSGGAASTADLDVRTSGNAAGMLRGRFELICQWGTITGIALNKIVAEVYLVPKLDGTNLPQIDTASGASNFPWATYAGSFVATKAPTASTDTRFVTREIEIPQELLTAHLKNVSGQTISANWTLKFYPSALQVV